MRPKTQELVVHMIPVSYSIPGTFNGFHSSDSHWSEVERFYLYTCIILLKVVSKSFSCSFKIWSGRNMSRSRTLRTSKNLTPKLEIPPFFLPLVPLRLSTRLPTPSPTGTPSHVPDNGRHSVLPSYR